MTDAQCWAVIPAAGVGERMGGDIPKQYLSLAGKTVLEHALAPFIDEARIAGITLALKAEDHWFTELQLNTAAKPIVRVEGGQTRAHSVFNALQSLRAQLKDDDFVLVHDAARPCLTGTDLGKLIAQCQHHQCGGILGTASVDTLKKISFDKQTQTMRIDTTINRQHVWRALTPQMFRFALLQQALSQALQENLAITDEASAMESLGHRPCMVAGDSRNIKITTVHDMAQAEMFIQEQL